MARKYFLLFFARLSILVLCTVTLALNNAGAQCGADINLLNENSGSVDAIELRRSREFITRMAIEFAPLATTNDQTRIAIADFADRGTFSEYDFPIATSRYITQSADILSFENSTRFLSGWTDVMDVTQHASFVAGLPAIPGRSVAKMLVIFTGAFEYQVTQTSAIAQSTGNIASGIFNNPANAYDPYVPNNTYSRIINVQ